MLLGFIILICLKLKSGLGNLVPFCSVPLNIIIGVDNYTLRNGAEQSLEMAKHKLKKKNNKGQANLQEGDFYR